MGKEMEQADFKNGPFILMSSRLFCAIVEKSFLDKWGMKNNHVP